ncbi:MAG: hypothetical protein GTO18_12830 [Anaerolineales bacterium]|nr:hypothetical protein [Anaerolineales bacterium]
MAEHARLELKTAKGTPLQHKYYKQHNDPGGLLITLPGNHYGVDGPLLYYPSLLLRDAGWDTLAITYGFQSEGLEFSPEYLPDVIQECVSAIQSILQGRDYPRMGLAGKSLGAFIIAQLCTMTTTLNAARLVLLTPPLEMPFFTQLIPQIAQPMHMVIGTEDRFYSEDALQELSSIQELSVTIVEGADHSMNVTGDLDASIEALRQATSEVVRFLLALE